jgi:hypothetical protein
VGPCRVGIAAVRRQAREARRASGQHERSDLSARAGEHEWDVRDVTAHQRGDAPRLDDVVREHDHRSARFDLFTRRSEPGDRRDIDSRGTE